MSASRVSEAEFEAALDLLTDRYVKGDIDLEQLCAEVDATFFPEAMSAAVERGEYSFGTAAMIVLRDVPPSRLRR